MRDNGIYAGDIFCLADIQVFDSRPHMGAVQQLTGEHARQLNIRTITGLAGDDILSTGCADPLTDYA